jgi:cell division protein FtsQ
MWKKAIIIVLDVVIAVYLVLALTAFNKPDEEASVCSEVRISIEQTGMDGFLTQRDVQTMLKKKQLYPLSQPMARISTRDIEELLESNALIEDAECYKSQGGHVLINVKQRIPVVRVMAQNGDAYYVDSRGEVMPHSPYTCDVIIVTGAVTRPYAGKVLAPLAGVLLADKFWKNQVEQLNVLSDGSVELVPRVGDHIVYLGQPVRVAKKLERLRKFYRYGLAQTGWNKYSRISVEFDNQIICKKTNKK